MNFFVSARSMKDMRRASEAGLLSTKLLQVAYSGVAGSGEDASSEAAGGLLDSPAWVTLRTALLQAVRPFPEARAALIAAVRQALETKGGSVHATSS